MTLEEIEERMYDVFAKRGGMDFVSSGSLSLFEDFLRQAYEAGVSQENMAWLEGKHCEHCGKPKEPHPTWSMCDDCV